MVEVLVGQRRSDERGEFTGFWAVFDGEKVSSREYKDGRVYTLYSCAAYNWEAYRVHIEDEVDPGNPEYRLLPYAEDREANGMGLGYAEPYAVEQLAYNYPVFLKDLAHLRKRNIDPR